MSLALFRTSQRNRPARRAIALLLLSLSLVDLAVIDLFAPELCEGARVMAPLAQTATNVSGIQSSAQQIATVSGIPLPNSSVPLPLEEDCFCCCAHVLPSAYFKLPALPVPADRAASLSVFLPTAPPSAMFRPPRFA